MTPPLSQVLSESGASGVLECLLLVHRTHKELQVTDQNLQADSVGGLQRQGTL